MMKMRSICVAIVIACFSGFVHAADQAPIGDFVRQASYSSAKISPDGKYLAITVDMGEQDVLTVLRMGDLSVVNVNRLPDNRSVGAFHWTSAERLLFNATRKVGSFEAPFSTGEWFAVNADGSYPRPIIFYGTRDATQRSQTVSGQQFTLLDTLRDDDTNVAMLAYSPRSAEGAGSEVQLVDTMSGRRKTLARAPKENCSISLDATKQPRYAVCSSSRDEKGEFDEQNELYRRDDSGKWTLVNSSKSNGKFMQVYFTSEDGTVYATQSDGKSPASLGTLDPATGAFTEVFGDDVAEISDALISTDGKRILAVRTEAGIPKITLLGEEHPDARVYEGLAGAFKGQVVDFASATKDGKQIVVSVYDDTNPGELYLYDRDTGKARFLMKSRAWVNPTKMGKVTPFAITARDGQRLHGYVTLPAGGGRNLPMIVNPHGGPIGPRDDWGFNGEAQLLASRGYAVLQVNFRGSGGYGKAFQDAGHMQWAEGIQNDIIDATNWAIAQGHADKSRVCIYGGSFGGYSALMAPIRAPGMFQCAFGYVGIYDMGMMFEKGDIPERESGKRYLRRTLGTDKTAWATMSPASRAAEVKIPVYLAAGAKDRRAVPEQTEAMAAALKAVGNPAEGVIIQEGEMHGFYKQDNRVALYTKMLDFFRKHIGDGNGPAR